MRAVFDHEHERSDADASDTTRAATAVCEQAEFFPTLNDVSYAQGCTRRIVKLVIEKRKEDDGRRFQGTGA